MNDLYTIRPLRWHCDSEDNPDILRAVTSMGNYYVIKQGERWEYIYAKRDWMNYYTEATEEEAKQRCEEDYRKHLRLMLEPVKQMP